MSQAQFFLNYFLEVINSQHSIFTDCQNGFEIQEPSGSVTTKIHSPEKAAFPLQNSSVLSHNKL